MPKICEGKKQSVNKSAVYTNKLLLSKRFGLQPRSQGSLLPDLRSERDPRIWEITNKLFGGGAGKCEICLYRA